MKLKKNKLLADRCACQPGRVVCFDGEKRARRLLQESACEVSDGYTFHEETATGGEQQ